jgi:hypothetical protein
MAATGGRPPYLELTPFIVSLFTLTLLNFTLTGLYQLSYFL